MFMRIRHLCEPAIRVALALVVALGLGGLRSAQASPNSSNVIVR